MSKYQAYPEYKDSEVEWLGNLPNSWYESSLKYLLSSVIAGGTPDSSNEIYWTESGNGTPWVSIADITKNTLITSTNKDVTNLGMLAKNLKLLPKGTILYSIFASLGKIAVANKPLVTNQAILGLTPNKKVNNNFLCFWLSQLESHLSLFSTSNTQDNLNAEKVGNLPVFVPSLNEQTQIAAFLDHETAKIDTLIEKQQQLIELLKEKRQAVISHAVTKGLNPDAPMKDSGVEWLGEVPEHWNILKMGYECEVTKLTGFEYTNHWKPDEQGEIIALRGFNIQERYLDLQKVEKITALLSCKLSRSKLHQGDIVLPCTGTLGNASVIESDGKYHINQNIAKLTFSRKVLPDFAVFWLTSEPFRRMIDFNNTSGMQPVLLIGDIRNMRLPLPPLKEQQEIANYLKDKLSRFDKLIKKATSAINLIQERRTALISAAVTGKIDVRNWVAPTTINEAQQEVIA